MPSDATTFFLGFTAVFGALGWYLWHLERKVDDMKRRLDAVAAPADEGASATQKTSDAEDRP